MKVSKFRALIAARDPEANAMVARELKSARKVVYGRPEQWPPSFATCPDDDPRSPGLCREMWDALRAIVSTALGHEETLAGLHWIWWYANGNKVYAFTVPPASLAAALAEALLLALGKLEAG